MTKEGDRYTLSVNNRQLETSSERQVSVKQGVRSSVVEFREIEQCFVFERLRVMLMNFKKQEGQSGAEATHSNISIRATQLEDSRQTLAEMDHQMNNAHI